MNMGMRRFLVATAALGGAAALCGCLSARQEFLQKRQPQNEHFDPADVVKRMAETGAWNVEVGRAGDYNVGILRLGEDEQIVPRYHKSTDVTLVGVRGRAIVQVEEARYILEPGQVIVMPRMTRYAIIPHKGQDGFAALMICSPPYDARDVIVVD